MADNQEWLNETYENKLLRTIAGALYISLLQQSALARYGKTIDNLSPEERQPLSDVLLPEVMAFAQWASREKLGMPPGGLDPSGKAH